MNKHCVTTLTHLSNTCNIKSVQTGVLHGKQPPAFRILYLTTVPAIMSPKFFFFSYVLHSSYIVSPTVKTTEDTDQFGRQQVVYEKTWKEIWLHLYNPKRNSINECLRDILLIGKQNLIKQRSQTPLSGAIACSREVTMLFWHLQHLFP